MIGTLIGFLALGAAVVAFAKRDKIEAVLQRFDRENIAKRNKTIAALRTPGAHMALTVEEMDARVEPVEPIWAADPDTGAMRKRYLWRDEVFDDEALAQETRAKAVFEAAQSYYRDIDQQLRSLR